MCIYLKIEYFALKCKEIENEGYRIIKLNEHKFAEWIIKYSEKDLCELMKEAILEENDKE